MATPAASNRVSHSPPQGFSISGRHLDFPHAASYLINSEKRLIATRLSGGSSNRRFNVKPQIIATAFASQLL